MTDLTCDQVREEAAEFALDILDPDERAASWPPTCCAARPAGRRSTPCAASPLA